MELEKKINACREGPFIPLKKKKAETWLLNVWYYGGVYKSMTLRNYIISWLLLIF